MEERCCSALGAAAAPGAANPPLRARVLGFCRFAWVGVLAAATYAALALLFDRLLPERLLFTNSLAYLLGFFVSYFGQKGWTFNSDATHSQAFPKFCAVALLGFLINGGAIMALTALGLGHAPTLAVAVVLVSLCTFVLHRHWVFGSSPRGGRP